MSDLYDDVRAANAAAWCALKPHLPGFRHVKTTEQGTIRAETDDPHQAIEVWSHQPYNKPRRITVTIGREFEHRTDSRSISIESTATPTGHRTLIRQLPAFLADCRAEWERRAERKATSARRWELARDLAGIAGQPVLHRYGVAMTAQQFAEGNTVRIYVDGTSIEIDPLGDCVYISGSIPDATAAEIVRAIVGATIVTTRL